MKKMLIATMIMMTLANNVAFGQTIGEYEKYQIVKGNFEVVEINKSATLSAWSEPDFFGNQYRLYTYEIGGTEEVVCLKHHCNKEERKRMKAAAEK